MYPSSYFKISSSLMCLIFAVTFGFANGEMVKWMKSPRTSNHTLENEPIHYEEDTVSRLNRRDLSPIPLSEITNRKIEIYTRHLNLSTIHKLHHISSKNIPISDKPLKNAKFGAQMRGGKGGARGYREMREYPKFEGQFFEDSEVAAKEQVIKVFPNPAKDWITIYLPDIINVKQILLHDMTGTVVTDWTPGITLSEAGLIKISTENISPGTYTLRIVGNGIDIKPIRVLIKK